jgi:hypothetical protein
MKQGRRLKVGGIASGLRHLTATVRWEVCSVQTCLFVATPMYVFQISNACGFHIGADLIWIRILT